MPQSKLFDCIESDSLEPMFEPSKAIRNANYHTMSPEHLGRCQQIVYETLLEHPEGLTDSELEELTPLRRSSVNGRRNELVKMGFVVFSHKKDCPAYNGEVRLNSVWRAL